MSTLMKRISMAGIVALTGAFSGAAATDDLQTLKALLTELRQTRKAKYELINQWKDEKQQLEFLTLVAEENASALEKEIDELEKQKTELSKSHDHAENKKRESQNNLDQIGEWIKESCRQLLADVDDKKIVFDAELKAKIEAIITKDLSVTDSVITWLNVVQNAAIDSSRADAKNRLIAVGEESYSADILRVGGVLEYFITPDDRICGIRTANNSGDEWTMLDPGHAAWIRKAIRIVRKEIPPELVTVPVPVP